MLTTHNYLVDGLLIMEMSFFPVVLINPSITQKINYVNKETKTSSIERPTIHPDIPKSQLYLVPFDTEDKVISSVIAGKIFLQVTVIIFEEGRHLFEYFFESLPQNHKCMDIIIQSIYY